MMVRVGTGANGGLVKPSGIFKAGGGTIGLTLDRGMADVMDGQQTLSLSLNVEG